MTRPATSGPRVVKAVGGFTLLRKLGQGGMGQVYLARQEGLDREVALKVLLPQLAKDAEFVARFQREARAAALFQHPNVVAVYQAGTDADTGVQYIAFEYLAGGSLEGALEKHGTLAQAQLLHVLKGCVAGLRFAESKGLVHRDIKPENILFDAQGLPKLADLGLARSYQDPDSKQVTQTGVVLGTPVYMAPEQALGEKELDIRADIYSLGLCAWRCLTGVVPFDEDRTASALQILSRHINQDLPDVRSRAEVSDALALLIHGMTNRDRHARYESATALAKDLDRVIAGRLPEGPAGDPAVQTTAVGIVPPGVPDPLEEKPAAAIPPTDVAEPSSSSQRLAQAIQAGPTPRMAAGVLGVALVLGVSLAAFSARGPSGSLASASPPTSPSAAASSEPSPAASQPGASAPEPSPAASPKPSAVASPEPSPAEARPPADLSRFNQAYPAFLEAFHRNPEQAGDALAGLQACQDQAAGWDAESREALDDLLLAGQTAIDVLTKPLPDSARAALGEELVRLWTKRLGQAPNSITEDDTLRGLKPPSEDRTQAATKRLQGQRWLRALRQEPHTPTEARDHFLADMFELVLVQQLVHSALVNPSKLAIPLTEWLLNVQQLPHPYPQQGVELLELVRALNQSGRRAPSLGDLAPRLATLYERHHEGPLGHALVRELQQLSLLGQQLGRQHDSLTLAWVQARDAWAQALREHDQRPAPDDVLVFWLRSAQPDQGLPSARGLLAQVPGPSQGITALVSGRGRLPLFALHPEGYLIKSGARPRPFERKEHPWPRESLLLVADVNRDGSGTGLRVLQGERELLRERIPEVLSSATGLVAIDTRPQVQILLAPGAGGDLAPQPLEVETRLLERLRGAGKRLIGPGGWRKKQR